MNDASQNVEYELLAANARRGQGAYAWNSVPISDANTAEGGFEIAKPQEELRRLLKEEQEARWKPLLYPLDPTRANAGAAPRNPYRAPARVVPATEGEHLALENRPRTDTGPLAGLSSNEYRSGSREDELRDAALALFDRLSTKKRKWWKDQLAAMAGPTKKGPGDETTGLEPGASVDRKRPKLDERDRKVASDDRRVAAFDLAMPLSNEVLNSWNAYLRKKIDARGPAMPYFRALDGFLERVKARKRFHELTWQEKDTLGVIVGKIVETAA
jgi:hypothetical protein